MVLRVRFVGGPADGIEEDYPALERALPHLLWQDAVRARAGVYRRDDSQPRPEDGPWRYEFTGST